MAPAWQQDFIDKAPSWEGDTAWPILDTHTPPLFTVGIGCQVPLTEALTLPWTSNGATLDAQGIVAQYARVTAMEGGKVASYYRYDGCMMLSGTPRLALFQKRVDAAYRQLGTLFPVFDSYPGAVKTALLNLAFNLGIGGLLKYKRLLTAVFARDWREAANQCGVNASQPAFDARNAWCKSLFLSAALQ